LCKSTVDFHISQLLLEFLSYHIFIADNTEDEGLNASVIYYVDDTNIFNNRNITLMHVAL